MSDYRSFYIIGPNDDRYKTDQIIVESMIRVVVNKMEVLLFTNKGDVMADLGMGCDLEFYLWQSNVSSDFIKSQINLQFLKYISELNNISWTLDVNLLEGSLQDILIIDIFINGYSIRAIFR